MTPLKERLTESESAYLAGLFDGEGCVGYYKRQGNRNKYSYVSVVMIAQSDLRLMLWLESKIGFGTVTSRAGKKHFEYHWSTNKRQHVKEFLEVIQPYLILKKDQVDTLLMHIEQEGVEPLRRGMVTPDVLLKRENVYQRLRQLKVSNLLSIH